VSAQADTAYEAYEALAPRYDDFTAHHDYEGWLTTLEGLALEHGLEGEKLLDVACGTGKSFEPLLARGYEVAACDLSPAMLARAAAERPGAALRLADMRALPALGEFDLITCLDDALNYLLAPEDLRAAFRGAAARLRPGGLYLFDVNTLRAYREFFQAETAYEVAGTRFAVRGERAPSAAPGALFGATVEAHDHGAGPPLRSRHVQRHHPQRPLRAALAAAGLECLGAFGLHPDGALDRDADEALHTKFVYVAGKAA